MTDPVDPNTPPAGETPPAYGGPPPPPYGAPPPPPPYGAPPAYGAAPPPYGAPPPPYGAPPTYEGYDYHLIGRGDAGRLANWGERAGGYLIDLLIIAVPAIVIGLGANSRVAEQVVSVIGGLILGYINGAYGQTPGKRVLGIKLVREQDSGLLGGGMGMVRWLCHILDSLALLLGWLWPLWDAKRQTFADKIVKTVVIKI